MSFSQVANDAIDLVSADLPGLGAWPNVAKTGISKLVRKLGPPNSTCGGTCDHRVKDERAERVIDAFYYHAESVGYSGVHSRVSRRKKAPPP